MASMRADSRAHSTPLGRRLSIGRQRRVWTKRAAGWDHAGSPGLHRVASAVLEEADVADGEVVVDLGCGTGRLSLLMARIGARVIAVDVSPEMVRRLGLKAKRDSALHLQPILCPIEGLDLPPGSVDVVVSNYALHHLRDRDKAELVERAARWLRPGGRVVIGDMMFGRGASSRDRAIIAEKVSLLLRRGPGGWWRIAKNGWRYLSRTQERPLDIATWAQILVRSGLVEVRGYPVLAEAAIVVGVKPDPVFTGARLETDVLRGHEAGDR